VNAPGAMTRDDGAGPDKEQATPMKRQHLTLVGLTEDLQRLVLVSDAGEEFTLAVDAPLRAALRGEHARLGQLEITMDSALRPRDIQARIRAGESPEAVAAVAQTTLDRIMAFATPVLAERAHIADRAQRASLRRTGEGSARVLADAVAERLRGRDVDPQTVEWDSWRRDDGRWTLVADYRSGESARHAEFVYDTAGRYVVAEDDEARWLVGEPSTSHGPQPRTGSGPRRLSAVGRREGELPLGEDAIELVADPVPPSSAPSSAPSSVAPEDQAEAQAQTGSEPEGGHTADADWIAVQATRRPVELGSEADEPDGPGDEEATVEVRAEDDEPAARRPAKKGRRPSVPSWDEIMFGGSTPRE
jgi:hypothetical protein